MQTLGQLLRNVWLRKIAPRAHTAIIIPGPAQLRVLALYLILIPRLSNVLLYVVSVIMVIRVQEQEYVQKHAHYLVTLTTKQSLAMLFAQQTLSD